MFNENRLLNEECNNQQINSKIEKGSYIDSIRSGKKNNMFRNRGWSE
jgi:hypothetical protein